jgi:zinc protease
MIVQLEAKMSDIMFRRLVTLLTVFMLLFTLAPGATASNIVRATLKNGLRIVVVRNTLAPVATTQINYLVGSDEAPPGFPGMAHAQEHMMFRGSPGLSADQLAALMASMGGEFNADTQQTVTQYFSTVPAEDLKIVLQMEAVRMSGVLDSDKLWAKERGAIEQEVAQDLSNPEYLMSVRLLARLFAETPYSHDALGTRDSFDKTTGAMLKSFYRSWYAPNNAIIVIVGNIDPEKTLAMVKSLFGPIKPRPLPSRPLIKLQPVKPATVQMESDLAYGLAVAAYRLPGYENGDYAAGQVLADVLDSQRGDLYALVPEGKALFTSFDSEMLPKGGAGYAVAGFPQGGDGTAMVAILKETIAGYVKGGIPVELVEAVKRHELADAEFRKNSISGLASIWSQALAVEGRNSPDDDIEAIRKVTVDDVNRVARKWLVNDNAITAVLIPRPTEKPVEANGFGRPGESFTSEQTKPVKLPPWAKETFSPSSSAILVKPVEFRLANGLRLLVRQTAISNSVSVFGRVKNNPVLEALPGKEGVDGILDSLFSYGTTTLDRLAYRKALDDIAADASAGTNFSLQALTDNFKRGVELLADNLLHPAIPENAFRIVQKESASALVGEIKSPSYLAQRAFRQALYPKGDPALRRPTPETIAGLTLQDVKQYYHTVFRPDMTTIVVIGDLTPEMAKKVIEQYFGGWQGTGPRPNTDLPHVPPNTPAMVDVPDKSRVQDEVILAETLPITRSHPDYYPLQVGLNVLSGAFYASRLSRDLREHSGLVYTVEAFLDAGNTRSIFGVVYGSDPKNVQKASAMVGRDLKEMQKKPVKPSELQQAKTILIRQLMLNMASTASIAGGLLKLSLLDLPLDEPARAMKHYEGTTAKDVKDAFERWIRTEDFVQIIRGPTPQ